MSKFVDLKCPCAEPKRSIVLPICAIVVALQAATIIGVALV